MQPLQQLGFSGASVWPPYTPQIIFNIGTGPLYYPQTQVLPQLQPATAVSKDIDRRRVEPIDVSTEYEKALLDALETRKEGGPTVQQVLKELSQKNGDTEHAWEKWFIANFERLSSKAPLDRSEQRVAPTCSTGSRCAIASRTRSKSRQRPSRSSTITLTNERMRPRDESESESESEQLSGDDEGSTYRNSRSSSVVQRNRRQHPRVAKSGKTAPVHPSPFTRRQRAPVTDTDLRAMALYRFKKGDDRDLRRYRVAAWRGFAHRPENYLRRTLDAWINIPRKPAHAAAIDRYVEEYRRVASGTNAVGRTVASPSGLEIRIDDGVSETGQGRAVHSENAGNVSDGHVGKDLPLVKRRKVTQYVDPDDIIDLTVDSEVEE
ncbi:hypothetical protein V8D89_002917 [Ganoderma adspersum]